MILAFMFWASWRLTTVTFIIVPTTILVSKVYGSYYRKLAKATQDELAGANTVAEVRTERGSSWAQVRRSFSL